MRLVVPRACLGDPTWIQARVAATTTVRDETRYVDIAGSPLRGDYRVWTRRLRVG